MSAIKRISVAASFFGSLASAWLFFKRLIDAAMLPKDLQEIWGAIVKAPDYIPWLILTISIASLTWAWWPIIVKKLGLPAKRVRTEAQTSGRITQQPGYLAEQQAYREERARQKAIDDAELRRQFRPSREPNALNIIRDVMKDAEAAKRRRLDATLANPMPNIGMDKALALIVERTGKIDEKARAELHDLASAGQIIVWARHFKKDIPNPLFAVPIAEWAHLYPFWWSDGRPGVDDQSVAQRGNEFVYSDLQFCKEQLEDYFARRSE